VITITPVEEEVSAVFGLLKAKKSVSLEQMESNRSVPLLSKEGLGEVLLDAPPQSPFHKGGEVNGYNGNGNY